MGLLDAYKQKRADIASQLAALNMVEYMGGYGDQKKSAGNLYFYEERVDFKVALNPKSSFTISTADITNIAIEGKDEVNRRVTVTRLIAVGIFAFALKKKSKDQEAFVTLELSDGQEVIFHVSKKSPMELRASLSKALLQNKQS